MSSHFLEDGETVVGRIIDVALDEDGFRIRYTIDGGERTAILPTDPRVAVVPGRELVKVGRLLRLTVYDDGRVLGEVRELAPARHARCA